MLYFFFPFVRNIQSTSGSSPRAIFMFFLCVTREFFSILHTCCAHIAHLKTLHHSIWITANHWSGSQKITDLDHSKSLIWITANRWSGSQQIADLDHSKSLIWITANCWSGSQQIDDLDHSKSMIWITANRWSGSQQIADLDMCTSENLWSGPQRIDDLDYSTTAKPLCVCNDSHDLPGHRN